MAEIKFEIVDHLLELSIGAKGWAKEVNLVSWNDRKPKIDIREWDETHEKMGKGITLNKEELIKLKDFLQTLDIDKLGMD
jgi:hypothetical protein